ncbi:MAG: ATP-binding protein, partial [Symploca sp. SIO1B1]|nr:ATP-binding protein [Symploca sp. SIO1B1]
DVKDSMDRYANGKVSYLLQRMEAYQGLAILTTNLRNAIDGAFMRRIRFHVAFPFPDEESRERIWQGIYPKGVPVEGLDSEILGELKVAGGTIQNIIMNAAFVSAASGEVVVRRHIWLSAKREYEKRKLMWRE